MMNTKAENRAYCMPKALSQSSPSSIILKIPSSAIYLTHYKAKGGDVGKNRSQGKNARR
jgi:hypothetical protein